MKASIKILFLIVASAFVVPAMAQQVSLDSILTAVKARNPMLRSYTQRANAMNTYAGGAKSLMAPEVGGGLWMLPYHRVSDQRDKGQYMVTVQQKFTHPAKLRAYQSYLESKAAIEQADEGLVFNELKAQAKLTYYQWCVLEKRKQVLQENEELIGLLLQVARLRYPYNQSKLGNIYKAEGRLEEVRNMILMNNNQILQKNLLLNQLMNVPNDVRFAIDTAVVVRDVANERIDSAAFAETRSDLRRIDSRIRSMKLNQELESQQAKPDFSLSFNQMFARGAGMPNQFMLLGMVSIPIAPWSSKMYKSNVKGMGMEIESMKSERAAILNEAVGMTESMAEELHVLGMQINNYKTRILPALRRNYETLMRSYEENKEELPVVIDGWETLNMTQMQYLDTLQKYLEMTVTYEKQFER